MQKVIIAIVVYSIATIISFMRTLLSWQRMERYLEEFPVGDLELVDHKFTLMTANLVFPISILMLKIWVKFCTRVNANL